jgi:23S rRNA (guanine745-N1)-methyltransferase
MLNLQCTVRGCEAALHREASDFICAEAHRFNIARSGYVNLLQPQDRRSKSPGDSKETVAARARLSDAGHSRPLLDAIHAAIGDSPTTLIDLGSGHGYFLAALQSSFRCAAAGIDISTPAIDLAARRHPSCTWIVSNADRRLPFADGSVDVALAITGRTNPSELARIVAPAGRFVIAVPAPDDQVELREKLYVHAFPKSRFDKLPLSLTGIFDIESHSMVRYRATFERADLLDLLLTTYRGARHRERERLAEVDLLDVTQCYDLLTFRRRSDILTRSPSTEPSL